MSTSPSRSGGNTNLIVGLVAAVVFVGLLFAALSGGGGEGSSGDPADAFGSPTVTGEDLPELPQGAATAADDPATGQPVPTVSGPGIDGETVTVGTGPQIVALVAHWCPHCRNEVPVVVQWVADGRLPDGVDLVAIATGTDPTQPNFPPTTWLEREDWPTPVLLDDEDDTAGTAYGVSGFPFWVAIDADGNVAARTSGELTPAQLDALAAAAAS